jgi:hypothetical protein
MPWNLLAASERIASAPHEETPTASLAPALFRAVRGVGEPRGMRVQTKTIQLPMRTYTIGPSCTRLKLLSPADEHIRTHAVHRRSHVSGMSVRAQAAVRALVHSVAMTTNGIPAIDVVGLRKSLGGPTPSRLISVDSISAVMPARGSCGTTRPATSRHRGTARRCPSTAPPRPHPSGWRAARRRG